MAAQIPCGELVITFKGLVYKIWSVRYDATVTTFTVNMSTTGISVVEPVSGGPAVSLGSSSNGEKTATIAAGGSAKGDGTITIVTVHGTTVSGSSVG